MHRIPRRALLGGAATLALGTQAGAQTLRHDLLIKGGEVVDPSQGLRGRRDVAISNGLVVAVEPDIPASAAAQVIDASGKLVCPGLVDLHAHVYPEVSAIGLPADELVPWTATTTYVSAGDAGSSTFSLFRHAVLARSRTRLLGFVHIANIGLAGFPVGEMLNIDNAIVELAAKTAAENRDVCLGIKVRMTTEVVGTNGLEPLKRAIQAAEMAGPWAEVMCHIGNAPGNHRGGAGPAAPRRHPDARVFAVPATTRCRTAASCRRRCGRSSAAWSSMSAMAAAASTTRCSSPPATRASARTPSAATSTRYPATRRACPSCPG